MKSLHQTYAALMALLALTVGASFLELGAIAIYVSLLIAVIKAGLVIAVFMQVRDSGTLVKLALVFSIVWIFFFYALVSTDVLAR